MLRSLALLAVSASALSAQQADFRWEKALAAGSTVSLHNLSGDVTVVPSTNGKVEVVGIKHGRDRSDITLTVVETSRGITVCPLIKDADMDCDEGGFRMHSHHHDDDWDDASIDMQVKVPTSMLVEAHSVSGNVNVTGAQDRVRAGSVSGDVRLEALNNVSSVRASSVSGDVTVRIQALTGSGTLEFSSVSGNITAELPRNIDADVSMRSVSGELDSEFPLTLNGRMNRRSLEARIGKGGRDLEVHTVSGDVRLRMAK
jgi:hypothetical protein